MTPSFIPGPSQPAASAPGGRGRRSGLDRRKSQYVRLDLEVLEERCLLDGNPATQPIPVSNPYTMQVTMQDLTAPKGNPQVVFLGDSLTQLFQDGSGAPVWSSKVAPMNADNFAVFGNTTSNILWQLQMGQLSGIHPQVVVIEAGGNNLLQGQSPQQTADGVAAIIQAVEFAQPQARILVVGVVPGIALNGAYEQEGFQTNALLASMANGNNIFFTNVGAPFLLPDGQVDPFLYIDGVHPTETGYQDIAQSLVPTIQGLLKMGPVDPSSMVLPSDFESFAYPSGYTYPAPSTPAPTPTPAPSTTPSSSTPVIGNGLAAPIIQVLQGNPAAVPPAAVNTTSATPAAPTTTTSTSFVYGTPDQADLSSDKFDYTTM